METSTPTPRPGRFELSGGALCLDFANTWAYRGDPKRDYLKGPELLAEFAVQTELCATGPVTAELFAEALALRELLYAIFAGAARGEAPQAAQLERLNPWIGEAHAALRLACRDERCDWSWDDERCASEPRALLWPIVRSAAQLLTSDELDRVRECGGPDCSWLFLDRSRSRQRRWCSMESCGNRAKARRHYRRKRQA